MEIRRDIIELFQAVERRSKKEAYFAERSKTDWQNMGDGSLR